MRSWIRAVPRILALLLLPLLQLGCPASVGVSGVVKVPTDGLQQCEAQCRTMGMKVGAVVAMANTVGCVCEPKDAEGGSDDHGSALAGGMAAIVLREQQEQQQPPE